MSYSTANSHKHRERDTIKHRAEQDFRSLFESYGGTGRGAALYCPFHKNTRTPAASIFNGRFHCFGCGVTYDVFDFVQQKQHCDFRTALTLLAARYGVPLSNAPLSPEQKRAYAQRHAAAEAEALQLVRWRKRMDATLRDLRDVYFHAYHRSLRYILKHGLRSAAGRLAADACELCELRYRKLDRHVQRLKRATYAELLPLYRRVA